MSVTSERQHRRIGGGSQLDMKVPVAMVFGGSDLANLPAP